MSIEPFATFINGVAKHVATSAPLELQWTNARVIDGYLVESCEGRQWMVDPECPWWAKLRVPKA